MHLPVIVESNASTLPQERYNAEWIEEKQVGIAIRRFRSIARAVDRILEPGELSRFRANAAILNNRAVFEIPPILQAVLEGASSRLPASA
jgi:1,2-diacylglycerol 3-beta-galactosyltransferase